MTTYHMSDEEGAGEDELAIPKSGGDGGGGEGCDHMSDEEGSGEDEVAISKGGGDGGGKG